MDETEYVFRPPGQPIKTKCAVLGCVNHSNEGLFYGMLCMPCHVFISNGTLAATKKGFYSQAYRNMQAAIEEEREACAHACENMFDDDTEGGVIAAACAATIRARGEE